MSKISQRKWHTLFAVSFVTVAALLVALGAKRVAKAQDAGTLNLVYVESNITSTNGNTVLGFSNDGLGNLTPLPGSPYLTDGTGMTGTKGSRQFDADGEILVNPEGTLLLAVNGGSNTVTSFNINADGSLTPAVGSPVASGGADPVSLGLKDNALPGNVSLLVVVNKANPPNYTTFDVDSSGVMTMNAGSTFNLPTGTSPGQAIPFPKTNRFFGIEFLNNTVSSYQLHPNGTMAAISSVTPPGSSPQVLGGVVHPTKTALYVALPNQSQIAAYHYDSTGTLTFESEVANPGLAVCWLAMNASGTRLYSANSGSHNITVYNTSVLGNPSQLQTFTLAQVNGASALPTSMAFDPTGKFLYAVDQLGALHVLNSNVNGKLSEPGTPVSLGLPAGTVPLGVATLMK